MANKLHNQHAIQRFTHRYKWRSIGSEGNIVCKAAGPRVHARKATELALYSALGGRVPYMPIGIFWICLTCTDCWSAGSAVRCKRLRLFEALGILPNRALLVLLNRLSPRGADSSRASGAQKRFKSLMSPQFRLASTGPCFWLSAFATSTLRPLPERDMA